MITEQKNYIQTANKLITLSEKMEYHHFKRIDFKGSLDTSRLQFPEKYISLYHHPVYRTLSDEQKWKISLLETVNFFSLNIHGEQHLVTELEQRLYRNKRVGEDFISSQYIQHFIHEENSHTYMLAKYCSLYHNGVFPNYDMVVEEKKFSPVCEDLLFYSKTLVLETFLGHLNNRAQKDDTLDSVPREIHHHHLIDEVRHIMWDKAMIEENYGRALEQGLESELAEVIRLIQVFIQYASRKLYNPRVYKEVGLENGSSLISEAEKSPERAALMEEWKSDALIFFRKVGMFKDQETNN